MAIFHSHVKLPEGSYLIGGVHSYISFVSIYIYIYIYIYICIICLCIYIYIYLYLEPKCPSFLEVDFLTHPFVQKTSFWPRGRILERALFWTNKIWVDNFWEVWPTKYHYYTILYHRITPESPHRYLLSPQTLPFRVARLAPALRWLEWKSHMIIHDHQKLAQQEPKRVWSNQWPIFWARIPEEIHFNEPMWTNGKDFIFCFTRTQLLSLGSVCIRPKKWQGSSACSGSWMALDLGWHEVTPKELDHNITFTCDIIFDLKTFQILSWPMT